MILKLFWKMGRATVQVQEAGARGHEGVWGRGPDHGRHPGARHWGDPLGETVNSAAQTPRGQLHVATSQMWAGNGPGGLVCAQVLRGQDEGGCSKSKEHQAVIESRSRSPKNALAKHQKQTHPNDPPKFEMPKVSGGIRFNLDRQITEALEIERAKSDPSIQLLNQRSEWGNAGLPRLRVTHN